MTLSIIRLKLACNYLDVTSSDILIVMTTARIFRCWLRHNSDDWTQISAEGQAADPSDNNRDSPIGVHHNNCCVWCG
jgi:hypothetical protein